MSDVFNLSSVVFDMDGLLLDSERKSQEVMLKAAAHLKIPLSEEQARGMVGKNAVAGREYIAGLFQNHTTVDSFFEVTNRFYQDEWENGRIPLKRGVVELLDTLDSFKIPRAIATSTRRHIALQKLSKVGIIDRFHHIVGGDEVMKGKPNPEIYLTACSALGVSPIRSLACEDSPSGIEAAYTAGLRAILVPDLISPTERMRSHAWRVVANLDEVNSLIRAIETAVAA